MEEQKIMIDTVYFGGSVAIYANNILFSYRKQFNADYAMLYNDLLEVAELGIIKKRDDISVSSESIFWCTKYGRQYGQDYWMPPTMLELITNNLAIEHKENETCPYCK